ncbi:MAG: spondin domain-containing protein [Pseudomonadota bacterium]
MLTKQRFTARASVVTLTALLVAACDSDSGGQTVTPNPPPPPPPPAMASFDVTVTNLTNAQPLSPVAVIAHDGSYSVFTLGMPATAGLETLAEGGDNSALIAEADADAAVITTVSGAAPIGPGGNETVSFTLLESELPGLTVSVSTMLVNTNDAISGPNRVSIENLAVGDSVSVRSIAYDAGTEANSEEAIHIPGPAGGGEGFNAARDDIADHVSMHQGVVGTEDGFATSDLNNQHRFDNAVTAVRIERTQ